MSVVLARGRAADVLADGPGRVRRRYRTGQHDCSLEAEVMRHARAHGLPVPEGYDAAGSEIVMERIDGRTMLEDLTRRPWLARTHAERLAELHLQLHRIVAPAFLESRFGS